MKAEEGHLCPPRPGEAHGTRNQPADQAGRHGGSSPPEHLALTCGWKARKEQTLGEHLLQEDRDLTNNWGAASEKQMTWSRRENRPLVSQDKGTCCLQSEGPKRHQQGKTRNLDKRRTKKGKLEKEGWMRLENVSRNDTENFGGSGQEVHI